MANYTSTLFYLDIGFSTSEIGSVVKLFGFWATIIGGLLGGLLTAIQYALLSSFMGIPRVLVAALMGFMVEAMGLMQSSSEEEEAETVEGSS